MFKYKILIVLSFFLFSLSLYSQDKKDKKVENFFLQVQSKKLERLQQGLINVDEETKNKIINTVSKYDKKIFEIRKGAMHKMSNDFTCENKLNRMENRLKMRNKIISLQIEKIQELKSLNIKCEIITKIIVFERKFMRKLGRKMKRVHGNHR